MKKLTGFSPFLSARLPGGSEILDRNLLALKDAIGPTTEIVNKLTTVINIGSPSSGGLGTGVVQATAGVLSALSLTPGLMLFGGPTGLIATDAALSYDATNHVLHLSLTDGVGRSLVLDNAGFQSIEKQGTGQLFVGTSGVQDLGFYTHNIVRLTVDSSGNVLVATLNAGGLVYADAGTGQLKLASVSGGLSFTAGALSLSWPITAPQIAAPSAPGGGFTNLYVDSTAKNLWAKTDAGVLSHTVKTQAGTTHQFIKSIADDGSSSTGVPDALLETGGPTTLTVAAVPDSNPYSSVLIRLAGTSQIVGTDSRNISSQAPARLYYFMRILSTPAALQSGEWVATSNDQLFGTGITVEYPNENVAKNITVRLNIISNVGVGGNVTITATRNGTTIGATAYTVVAGVTTGLQAAITTTTGSASTNDTYGLFMIQAAGATGLQLVFTYEMVLSP